MKALSEIRAAIIRFYNSKDMIILPVLKFVIAFGLFFLIDRYYGYMESIDNIFIILISALICALLPFTGTVAIGFVFIVINCFGISLEIGVFALCLYLLLFILIMRFVPKESFGVLAAPFAIQFNLPCLVPVTLGMLGRASAALAGVCAVISTYFLKLLPAAALYSEAGDVSGLEILKFTLEGIIKNTEMIMMIIVYAAVILITYLIRKLCSSYGWLLSVIIGTGAFIGFNIGGSVFLEVPCDMAGILTGSLISAAVCLVIVFFKFNAKYKGTKYLQLEDDEYYYFVKAVPKEESSFVEDELDDGEEDYFGNEEVRRQQRRPLRKDDEGTAAVVNRTEKKDDMGATRVLPKTENQPWRVPVDVSNRKE